MFYGGGFTKEGIGNFTKITKSHYRQSEKPPEYVIRGQINLSIIKPTMKKLF